MIINSLLDNDLYKFTTKYAIEKMFPRTKVTYYFIDRGNTMFPNGFDQELRKEIEEISSIRLSEEESQFLKCNCDYFDHEFIESLSNYRFNPAELTIRLKEGKLEIKISGLWKDVVLWEVPLLACVSELYYKMKGIKPVDVREKASQKARKFRDMKAAYTDFGTRRRFSFKVHDEVIREFINHSGKWFTGTSNVFLAMKHNLKPIGTHPHEWFMFHGAKYGYKKANYCALKNWLDIFKGKLAIALTDTFTTDAFLENFTNELAEKYSGVRWDSADPFIFTDKMIAFYKKSGIDPATKLIVYSDALNVKKVKKIREYADGKVKDAYGIGTFLTNDAGVVPLNIVIKLADVTLSPDNKTIPVVKLSDVPDKYTGDFQEIERCKKVLGIN